MRPRARRQAQLKREAEARLAAQQRPPSSGSHADAELSPARHRFTAAIEHLLDAARVPAAPPSQYGGVVGIAMQYLGKPYVWGGAEPGRLRLLRAS